MYNNIWISGNTPTIWKQAITIPILKKQDPTNPTSYRPIALTSCTCSPYRNFNQGRHSSKKEHLVAVLFDLGNAYDTTWPYGIPEHLSLQGRFPIFIKHFLEDWTFQTRMNSTLSDPKQQKIGVPQSSILSVILFMIKITKIRGSLNKFPDFFCMGTFIDSTHMKL